MKKTNTAHKSKQLPVDVVTALDTYEEAAPEDLPAPMRADAEAAALDLLRAYRRHLIRKGRGRA